MKFDTDDEFSPVKTDTLHVNYEHSDYFLSYTATLPRQDPSAVMTVFIHDPIQSCLMIRYPKWHFHKNQTCGKVLAQSTNIIPPKNRIILKTKPSSYFHHRFLET